MFYKDYVTFIIILPNFSQRYIAVNFSPNKEFSKLEDLYILYIYTYIWIWNSAGAENNLQNHFY